MSAIIKNCILLLIFINCIVKVEASSDFVFIDRMMTSDLIQKKFDGVEVPKRSAWVFRSSDKIIFYYAQVGIINPTKNKYDFDVVCIDEKGKIFIKQVMTKEFPEMSAYYLGANIIKSDVITMKLDTKSNASIKGQLLPLELAKTYFIKLYFEKKLIGITSFIYQ